MINVAGFSVHIDKTELGVGLVVVAVLGVLALWKKRFATSAEAWPVTEARIENVFLDVSTRGPNRREETHIVLAYAYSISDSYCSGQIRLQAGEGSLESAEEELVGQQVSIHYNLEKPAVSIFLAHEVGGWSVIADRRISLRSSLGFG